MPLHPASFLRRLSLAGALLLGATCAVAWAQAPAAGGDVDPPGRVATVTDRQGSVVFAPAGDDEWLALPPHRPLTAGDRVWTDAGGRAELHLGTATLHLDQASQLEFSALDADEAQVVLLKGRAHLRVRELAAGENVEVDTPQLALRAQQPGDYRVEVDPQAGTTRVTVAQGLATVYGEGGQAVQLAAGRSAAYAGRQLAQVAAPPPVQDAFAQWAAQRNLAEDQSVAARHVPRAVVGYPLLDAHGSWVQDAELGAVWLPQGVAADWAPYRDGRWEWIAPWGWTWIDAAPWGFAPFHYGRWATVGSRWGWVPGPFAARPLYAPALVAFFGDGGGSISLSFGTGPGVGWYPLAPGEAWWPAYRASPRYLGFLNPRIDLRRHPREAWQHHRHRHHGHGITAIGLDDFRRGRAVREAWRPVPPALVARAQFGVQPQRPERSWRGERRDGRDERGRDERNAAWRGAAPVGGGAGGPSGATREQRPPPPRQERPAPQRPERQLQPRAEQVAPQRPQMPPPQRLEPQPPPDRPAQPGREPREAGDWRSRDRGGDRDRDQGRDRDRDRDRDPASVRSIEPRQRVQPAAPQFQPQLTLPPSRTGVNPQPRQRAMPIGGNDAPREGGRPERGGGRGDGSGRGPQGLRGDR